MVVMTEREVQQISDEAIRIMRDYPEINMKEAVEIAKEVMKGESIKVAGGEVEYSR